MNDKQAHLGEHTNPNQPQALMITQQLFRQLISSMSDLLAASLSSLKTTMIDAFAEMHNTLGQITVENEADLGILY